MRLEIDVFGRFVGDRRHVGAEVPWATWAKPGEDLVKTTQEIREILQARVVSSCQFFPLCVWGTSLFDEQRRTSTRVKRSMRRVCPVVSGAYRNLLRSG